MPTDESKDVSANAGKSLMFDGDDLVGLHERRLMASATIMMIDDEQINMDVLRLHLENEGYSRFITSDDSASAIKQLRAVPPDVLLLDLMMPQVSGFDILAEMRRDETLRRVPVIVLTSSEEASTKLRALESGATDFLAKPVDPSELALRMRNTLASRAWQRRMSHIDAVTNLPNRLFFTDLVKQRLAKFGSASGDPADGAGGSTTTALILVNINRFKAINDSLGPASGDETLRAFRDRLVFALGARARLSDENLFDSRQQADRSLSCVARLGGDRFAVLLPFDESVPDCEGLSRHLDRFVVKMDEPFDIAEQKIFLSASIGVSMLNAESESIDILLNDAETAMRQAQRRPGTGYAYYSEQMDAQARHLLSLENGLRTAIDQGEIYVLYQPKVDVRDGTITGAEALVRWMNPEFGLISPVNFIPLAEDSGLIVSIGAWVLQESCRQAKAWHDLGMTNLKIAVNVSIRQLQESDFIDTVHEAIATSGLAPDSLIIELTENMIMEDAESSVIKLQQLKALGVKLSIDDFGTGYSSLSYLQRFPLDQLKIDRSFVSEITGPGSHAPIVKAVISLAHDLGLTVVAEGIETHHQLAHIRAYRCEEYQGYYCSKPVSADDFLQLIDAQTTKAA